MEADRQREAGVLEGFVPALALGEEWKALELAIFSEQVEVGARGQGLPDFAGGKGLRELATLEDLQDAGGEECRGLVEPAPVVASDFPVEGRQQQGSDQEECADQPG